MTSVRYVNDERNEEEPVRYIQSTWKVSRAAARGSLRSVRKLFDPRGIPSDIDLKEILRLQRAPYGIKREIKTDESFDSLYFGTFRPSEVSDKRSDLKPPEVA
jgi:hypothetical protein